VSTGIHHLHVLGDGEVRDAAVAERRAAGPVGDDDRMFRTRHFYVVERHILHDAGRIHALLKAHADEIVEGDSGQGDDRGAVQMRIVQSVQQMYGAGSGRPDAHAELPRVLRKTRRHERGRLFVPHPDIANAIAALAQGLDDGIDAIADDTERAGRAPGQQGFNDDVGGIEIIAESRIRLARDVGSRLGSLRNRRPQPSGKSRSGCGKLDEPTAIERAARRLFCHGQTPLHRIHY
jgi:hypothetical protein